MSADTMRLDAIKVGDRHRTDDGDLSDLEASIRKLGVLQPIGVSPDGFLLFGGRRLAACRRLGMERVPVRILSDITSAADLLTAERDENTCRKDMTPGELVRLGMALEELERPRARERQESTRFGEDGAGLENCTGQTRDIVGRALGLSGATYQRAKAVVEAAGDETAPEEVRAVAQKALAEMDSTGRVVPAYQKVREAQMRQQKPRTPQEKQPAESCSGQLMNPRLRHKRSAAILTKFVSQLAGIASAVDGVDFSGCTLDAASLTNLDASVRAILAVRRTLKGASS